MSKILDGKVAIITGASSGIGLATTKIFLDAGASVLGVDLSPAPESVPENETFSFIQVNIAEPTAAAAIIAQAQSAFPSGRVDILVNNAGIMDSNESIVNVSDATWERVMAVNVTAPMMLMREAVKVMKEQGGPASVVNVVSKAGMSGACAGLAYTASKHALVGMTKNTAWLFKDDNIRCNAIAPGAVATNIAANMQRETFDLESYMKMKPVHDAHVTEKSGPAPPERCASGILFLASDLSTGITGVVMPVDNGWSVI